MRIGLYTTFLTSLLFVGISIAQNCSIATYDFSSNAMDESGNGYDGIVWGATTTPDRNNLSNDAYLFDGVDDYIELNGNSPIITSSTEFTITSWAKMNGLGGGLDNQNTLFSQRDDLSGNNRSAIVIHLESASNTLFFGIRGDAGPLQRVDYTPANYGDYHFYAFVLDTDTMRMYIDGIQVANSFFDQTQVGNIAASIDYVDIGRHRNVGLNAGYFNGVIDDLDIYNCALSAEEINDLMYNCAIATYNFSGDAIDESGNGYDGTIFGTTIVPDRNNLSDDAYLFDGVNDYIKLNDNVPIITSSTEFTITSWAKMNGLGGGLDNQNTLFSQRDDLTGNNRSAIVIHLESASNTLFFGIRGDAGPLQRVDYTHANYGDYHFYAFVLDTDTMRMYIDGVQVANSFFDQTQVGNVAASINYVDIGRHRNVGLNAGYFNGVIDDLNIHNCALSEQKINDLMNTCSAQQTQSAMTSCSSVLSPSGTYTWDVSGTYNDTLTDMNGCDSILTIDLTILQPVTATDVQTTCEQYTWIDSNTYFTSIDTVTYIISGGAANGCDSVVTLDLTILQPVASVDTQTACKQYTWIDSNTYHSSVDTVTYKIVGGAANGCDSIVTLNLTIEDIDATVIESQGTLSADSTYDSYQWLDCTNNFELIPAETTYSFSNADTGVAYAVEIRNDECIDTSSCHFVYTSSLLQHDRNYFVQVFPNPTDQNFSINFANQQSKVHVLIYNSIGQIVFSKEYNNANSIDIDPFTKPGVYHLIIKTKDNEFKKRIIRL